MSKNETTSGSGRRKREAGPSPHHDPQSAAGGELHQIAGGEHAALTTNQGVPLSDNQNSLRANPRGPTLLEDFILREKITHFDHERIPERIVHARATGVHGFFELTASLKNYTTARILTEVGEKTPLFTRISTVAGGAGSVDTPREQRPGVLHSGCHQISRPHLIPINAPKCPFGNQQRDGHMQMEQPAGRATYEPNSLSENSPRETPAKSFHSAAVTESGEKGRIRLERLSLIH